MRIKANQISIVLLWFVSFPYPIVTAWLSRSASTITVVTPATTTSVLARYVGSLLYAKNQKDEEEFKNKIQRQGDDDSFPSNHQDNNNNNNKIFAQGNELKQIRDELRNLRESLMWAEAMHDEERMQNLLQLIESHEQRDPEHVYAQTLAEIAKLQATFDCDPIEKNEMISTLKQKAKRIRNVLPRFQMEGLWVGAFGPNNWQLINITYRGDTMVATKTTGDGNVPRGQTSFTADLSPPPWKNNTSTSTRMTLPVTTSRYHGQGQVAHHGFLHPKYVNGHLFLQDSRNNKNNGNDEEQDHHHDHTYNYDSFSFVWYAERQHKVVFHRPTPEQTLRLLRDPLSHEDEIENIRTHVTRCWDLDATDALARQQGGRLEDEEEDGHFRRIRRLDELENFIPEESKKEWSLWKHYWNEGIWKNLLNRKKDKHGWENDSEMMGF